MSRTVELPPVYTGLRAALGGLVEDDHYVARTLATDQRRRRAYLHWLDERYHRVFSSSRFEPEPGRLEELRRGLHEDFQKWDAEVQLAATVLSHPGVRLIAQAERSQDRVRTADFVMVVGRREFDVEVTTVGDPGIYRKQRDAARRLADRMKKEELPEGLQAWVKVERLVGRSGKRLDSSGEARVVGAATAAVRQGAWQSHPVEVLLCEDGSIDVDRHVGSGLAVIGLSRGPSSRPSVVVHMRMHAPFEQQQVVNRLEEKRKRRQQRGDRPYVVVLDSSHSILTEHDLIKAGIEEFFRTSDSFSAVVLQNRSLGSFRDDLGALVAKFYSLPMLHGKAKHPITKDEAVLFVDMDARSVVDVETLRPEIGGVPQ